MRTTITTIALLAVSGVAGQAAILEFYGNLVPGPSGATGTGTAFLTYDSDNHTLEISTTFSGLSGTTTIAHIHCCAGIPSPVATPTPTFPDFPAGNTFGSYNQTFDLTQASSFNASFVTNNGGSLASAEAALMAGIANSTAYLNIHSSAFGSGEIQAFFTPVPEPSSALLFLGAGLAGLVYRFRRRSR